MEQLIRKPKRRRLEQLLIVEDPVFDDNNLVDFFDTQIYRKELDALIEAYALVGKEKKNIEGIEIKEGHFCKIPLSVLYLPSLPESVGSWTGLEEIYLGLNKFSSLPDSIGNWKNLKGFYARDCQISSLPDSIGNWKKLRNINIAENPIEVLPESIKNWKNLDWMYITDTPMAENKDYISELKRKFPETKIQK